MTYAGPINAFWDRVDKRGPDECWPWTGDKVKFGYGILTIGRFDSGKRLRVLAHRLSYALANNAVVCSHMFVCHHCDNPRCVNPNHLFLGTPKDNMRDMIAKGRGRYNPPRGVKASKAKLRDEDIPKIRADTRSHRKIAAEYGVNHKVICHIKLRRLWAHVP